MAPIVHINPEDNVVVALRPLKKGETFSFEGREVTATEDIPQGHKMAVAELGVGSTVVKYGQAIGHVTADVHPGQWIHTHNMKTNLSGEVEYTYEPTHPELAPVEPQTFMGYRTKDGRAATRNEIWIIPTSFRLLPDGSGPRADEEAACGTIASPQCSRCAVPFPGVRELHAPADTG